MYKEIEAIKKHFYKQLPDGRFDTLSLCDGVVLIYLSLEADFVKHEHKPIENVVQISYCRTGQLAWKMKNNHEIYLNSGDFSLHYMKDCACSVMTFPKGQYEGLILCVDANKVGEALSRESGGGESLARLLCKRVCRGNDTSLLSGNGKTEALFSAFYTVPENFGQTYLKIKALELLIYLCNTAPTDDSRLAEYQSEQIDVIRKVHDCLLHNMDRRITIEELSKQYLINPTTLKEAFKSVYGTSIAAHIREHRMEQAAKMLRESDLSISEIARRVGFTSQSKFTSAFKMYFHTLPKDYRTAE